MKMIQFLITYTDKNNSRHFIYLRSSSEANKERSRLRRSGYNPKLSKIITQVAPLSVTTLVLD